MGVTFIGNPFDQENDFDDSDWEMNADEEWIAPPQEIALLEGFARGPIDIILAAGAESEDSDLNWFELNEEESDGDDSDFDPDGSDEYDDDTSCQEHDDDDAEIDTNDINTHSYGPDFSDSYDPNIDPEIDYVTYPLDDESVVSDKTASEVTDNNSENNAD